VQEHSGIVVDRLSQRKAELVEMKPVGGQNRIRLVFTIPSRGLIGYQSEFRNSTRGTGVLTRLFKGYDKFKGAIDTRRNGSLISSATGTTCVAAGCMRARCLCALAHYEASRACAQRVVCA
jgi:GTP-binding protein